MKKYPFFICVDDGGFPFIQDDIMLQKDPVPFVTYETILRLAKEFNLRIPIAFTMKYLDYQNISGFSQAISYAKKLIAFLEENCNYIEVAYHGLTHNYQNQPGEFSPRIPQSIQEDHIKKSKKIFESFGWSFPEIFIPPYHLWWPGVTDKILKSFGVKYIITSPKKKSRFLKVLPRGNLGIFSDDVNLKEGDIKRVKKYLTINSLFSNLRYHHRLSNQPFHSYITHIGNFMPSCFRFWLKFLSLINKKEDLYLVKNNQEATGMKVKEG